MKHTGTAASIVLVPAAVLGLLAIPALVPANNQPATAGTYAAGTETRIDPASQPIKAVPEHSGTCLVNAALIGIASKSLDLGAKGQKS